MTTHTVALEKDKSKFSPLSPLRRAIFVAIGSVTLVLGIIGAFVPGLPSTVFFLITIGCYARSSERLYRWLMTRRWLERPMRAALQYKKTNAIAMPIKLLAQSVAWSSVLYLIFNSTSVLAQIIGVAFALSCSTAMALIKTLPNGRKPRIWVLTTGDIAHQLALGALAGLAGGALWGLAARVIMRFIANLAGTSQPLDVPGTLSLLGASALAGALVGWIYAGLRSRLPVGTWRRGLTFGALVCVTLGAVLFANPNVRSELFRGEAAYAGLTTVLFVPAFIMLGLVISLVFGQLENRAGTRS
jgi:uncharacterized protein